MTLRNFLISLIVFALVQPDRGGEPAGKSARTDRYGDQLPVGAAARFGEARFCYPEPIDYLSFSPNSKTLLAGSERGGTKCPPRLWDTATGKTIRRFECQGDGFAALSFSSDGKHIVGIDGGSLRLWDAASGRVVPSPFRENLGQIGESACSADGTTLALVDGGGERISVWDMGGKKLLKKISSPNSVRTLRLSRDGKLLASGGRPFDGRPIDLWDARTGKLLRRLGEKKLSVRSLEFSPDGRTLMSAGDDTVRLWDVMTGRELRQLKEAGDCAAFSADGMQLASGGSWGKRPLRLWDVSTGRQLRCWKKCQEVYSLVFSPDGKVLAWAGYDRRVRLQAVTADGIVPQFAGHENGVTAVAFSPNGRVLASASSDRTVRLWEVPGGKRLHTLSGHEAAVARVVFALDGQTVASGDEGGSIRLWDTTTGKPIRQFACSGEKIAFLSFLPSSKALFAASEKGTLRLWDVGRGQEHPDLPNSLKKVEPLLFFGLHVALSPDGKVLTAGRQRSFADELVKFWRLPGGKSLGEIEPSGRDDMGKGASSSGGDAFEALTFSPDGRTLAVCVSHSVNLNAYMYCNSPFLSLWEVATSKELLRLRPEHTHARAISLSSDGKLLALEKDRGGVLIYDLRTGKALKPLGGNETWITSLAFSPDSRLLASGGGDGTILLWETAHIPKEAVQPAPKLSTQKLQALWEDLACDDAARANRSSWALAACGQPAVDFLRSRLQPAVAFDRKRAEQLLGHLTSQSFAVREKARRELEEAGELIETPLREVLGTRPSLEVRRRVEQLLDKLDSPYPPRRLRILRVVAMLERLGTADAQRLLREWAGGASDAWLTQEAKFATDRKRKSEARD